ncbi:hypothetical protein [Amycolatopsis albispora]|uniref:Uncharacterized protein n=1 Tax=Amycolatopsis albispora TaxID=1804986 RepID=A0A344L2M2_9PSEU|nr:hypothetical protein [Amycolatopsis albispora]AXB42296.1 hypothetical protein A4R43_06940 [Amycolatopsis albispora]
MYPVRSTGLLLMLRTSMNSSSMPFGPRVDTSLTTTVDEASGWTSSGWPALAAPAITGRLSRAKAAAEPLSRRRIIIPFRKMGELMRTGGESVVRFFSAGAFDAAAVPPVAGRGQFPVSSCMSAVLPGQ